MKRAAADMGQSNETDLVTASQPSPDYSVPQSTTDPSISLGPSQPSSNSLEDSQNVTQVNKRAKVKSAFCWTSGWFKMVDPKKFADGKQRAECTKCGQLFLADPIKNGTTGLNNHMKRCPNRDIGQTVMQDTTGSVSTGGIKVDPLVVRDMVLSLVVRNELPLRFVEYKEFRKLMLYVFPEYTPISRNTLLNDIHKVFKKEKTFIRESVKNSAGRVSVTTDLWTSIANDGYMTLTAHYIDREWVLHKKLIKFSVLEPPHSGKNICEAIIKILMDWGLEERLFSITVDNASANDVGINYLKATLNAKKALVCEGDFFHVRCCAHILNLIVQDGIRVIDESVQKIRDSVKYVKSSQKRKLKFEECCERVSITQSRGLHGDVTTRWNSTFQMLADASYYRSVFETLSIADPHYTMCPISEEWGRISKIVELLKPFDDVTRIFSGSKYPTSNLYFPNVVLIHHSLNHEYSSDDFMKNMIEPMREKFNKYWENYSLILSIAVVLDPRYKLTILKWGYNKIHDGDRYLVQTSIDRVRRALDRLYGEYKSMDKAKTFSPICIGDDPATYVEEFLSFSIMDRATSSGKSELEEYLGEPIKPLVTDFDVLAFWKVHEVHYPDLARLARDILSIPVSTVASESAFSAGGRVIDKYRSKLLPRNAEALICLRDWMCDVQWGAELDQDAEELDVALEDIFEMYKTSSGASTTDIS